MNDTPKAPGKPAAILGMNGRPLPGKPAIAGGPTQHLPRSVGRIMARARPNAVPVPADRRVSAFSPLPVLERWGEDAAGIRPAALEKGDNVITMFDTIGEDWWTGGGVTAKGVAAQLRAIGDRPVEVQINTGGGDMFEGLAIYNVLREHPQDITVKIMGMAASAGSIIAMAGDNIEIGAASFIMIHNCWVVALGNRHDMAEVAAYLAPFDQAMADVYAARTSQPVADCAKWMDAESWLSGSIAIERGFADALLPADQMRVDENAKSSDREANEVRALEMTLQASGMTRAQARARIKSLKGTPDAARDQADTQDAAGDTDLAAIFGGMINTLRT